MDDHDWNILSDAYDKANAEIATLRTETERLREALWIVFEHAQMYLPHLKEGFSVYDIAKEALA